MHKPLKFKAGFFTWKIIWSDEAVSEMFGKTDEVHKTITMYKHSNKQAERETLFHELLHAVGAEFYESIFNFEQDKKEIDNNIVYNCLYIKEGNIKIKKEIVQRYF